MSSTLEINVSIIIISNSDSIIAYACDFDDNSQVALYCENRTGTSLKKMNLRLCLLLFFFTTTNYKSLHRTRSNFAPIRR